jgi:hypothetical protein
MEILFKDQSNARPVYDYAVKQDWQKFVEYQCPAQLTESELKAIERVARSTFFALDCRDFARIDLRMTADGKIYVFEVNPLPGMTPDYSDLVLISKASGIDYDQLVAEIMLGGLRRLREKRREEREAEEAEEAAANGNGPDAAFKVELAAEKVERAAEKAEKAARKISKLARGKRGSSRRRRRMGGNGTPAAVPPAAEIPPTTH